MAVYIDDMNARLGTMIMCHMIADTKEELLQMADKIGVNRKWIQKEGTWKEHFDVSAGAKARAIEFGAIPISRMDLARKCLARAEYLKGAAEAARAAED